jgi:hypothetical protein
VRSIRSREATLFRTGGVVATSHASRMHSAQRLRSRIMRVLFDQGTPDPLRAITDSTRCFNHLRKGWSNCAMVTC